MFTLFLIGNIASGKSTVSRYLERRGALRIDLDELAKGLYQPGSQIVQQIADEFGWDVLDPQGGIDRVRLASRAFASPEDVRRLDAIVHPVLLEQLGMRLLPANCCSVMVPEHRLAVVEVSAAAGFTDAFPLADEVLAVCAPLELRRERAVARGMSPADFDARSECQPSDDELRSLAGSAIENLGDQVKLVGLVDAWLAERGIELPCADASEGGFNRV